MTQSSALEISTQSYTVESPETVAHLQDPGEIWQPPSEDELPCDDGEPMETPRHRLQMELLIEPLQVFWPQRDMFVGGNMFVYYGSVPEGHNVFVGPDVFVALDVPRERERKSWVVWGEMHGPDVVIELLSESTGSMDKTSKKAIYQDKLHVPEYFWYDPFGDELAGFRLDGRTYRPIQLDEQGRLVCQALQLALVPWQGTYRDLTISWLRWATLDGHLLPTGAEAERQRADEAQQRADDLAALLARYQARFGDLNGNS